jgi:hypothetical protein
MLRSLGFINLPDQSNDGSDYVLNWQLGIPRCSELYARGFLSGGIYEPIPLEGRYLLSRIIILGSLAAGGRGLWP